MKVGILSMQEVKNYGSFLQAYSLKKNIESLGHTVEFINIIPGEQIGEYKISKGYYIKLLIDRLWHWNFLKRAKAMYTFRKRFDTEFLPELGVKKKDAHLEKFDVVVIGSDEVFNCSQKTWFGFSPQLFGEGINSDKVISYAGSFGATTIERLEKLGLRERVARYFANNFKAISVRDLNSVEVVQTLTGKKPTLNVDPVFLTDWSTCMPKKHVPLEDYMVVYTYPGRISEEQEVNAICEYAKANHLKILCMGGHLFPWADITMTVHPFEVLAYIRDAKCIVTDTFHGSIFSIVNNKPFCTIVRDMNRNKLTYLLKQFGLENRITDCTMPLSDILDIAINYTIVNGKISIERKRSMDYLMANLK